MRLDFLARAAATLLVMLSFAVVAGPRVQAVGLMKDAAVLRIDGEQKFLRVGQTGPGGVKLVRSDSRSAVIEYQGERRTLTLSREVSTQFEVPERTAVQIARDEEGQYRVRGSINGQPVEFLVDTGATAIAMNAAQARRLGFDYRVVGDPGIATTASGQVSAYSVNLERVKVGEIVVRNVRGVILEGSYPEFTLLGMTFLSQVSFEERGGVMEIRSRF